ncbi:GNAT family N-acetyltransferase [Anaerotignum sp.]|uniref:GNAT family N-acetyltransferase n=1 Tax=Anaerotignum sp. TaxID=2039241 RepID=UPI0027144D8F|nr:GNAT family N-acetyltransferase [Anaerotignum sp.]
MKLRRYEEFDAKYVVAWVQDEIVYYQWCAGLLGEYPLTEEKINAYYNNLPKDVTFWAMTAEIEDEVVGHITLRFADEERKTVRLGFVLIAHARRGQGIGKELVSVAIRYAQQVLGAQQITLGVFEENIFARKCYESLGFIQNEERIEKYQIKDEVWDFIEMIYMCPVGIE